MARMSARTQKARAPRTLAQKLGAIVLGFESVVVFLAGLTVYGLKALPDPIPDWWGIVGGVVLGILMIAVAGAIARPGAMAAGWILQAVVLSSAILVPAIALVALIFGGMWGYATIMGARMDRRHTPPQNPTESQTGSERHGH